MVIIVITNYQMIDNDMINVYEDETSFDSFDWWVEIVTCLFRFLTCLEWEFHLTYLDITLDK